VSFTPVADGECAAQGPRCRFGGCALGTPAAAPFFFSVDDRGNARAFARHFPDEVRGVVEAADRVLAHEFDLLGSGPTVLGTPLPWHEDFKTGRRWRSSSAWTSNTTSSIVPQT
jgi:hypothetical protein